MIDYTTDFPPSFDGNPWSYGMDLCASTLMVALCMAQLGKYLFEARRWRLGDRVFGLTIPRPAMHPRSASNIHRWIIAGFLLGLICRAGPDVLVLYFWGEAGRETMANLFALDRYSNTIAAMPVVGSLALLTWAAQAIPQQLIISAQIAIATPKWEDFRQGVKIAGVVLAIAIMVTIGKANA